MLALHFADADFILCSKLSVLFSGVSFLSSITDFTVLARWPLGSTVQVSKSQINLGLNFDKRVLGKIILASSFTQESKSMYPYAETKLCEALRLLKMSSKKSVFTVLGLNSI